LVSMSSSAGRDHYRPFAEITQGALRFAALKLGLDLSPQAEATLLGAYHRLDPFAENRAVLEALQQRGITTGVLSNGDPPMLEAVVRNAGFDSLLQHVISVEACRRFKTDPAAYNLGTQALQLAAEDILFVSSNAWDAIGATWFGYTTLWINRSGAPPEQLGTEPSHTGRSLDDVLPLLTGPNPGPSA
ncbi:MAG TPA: haloacid dehalogenase type II, partial [Rubrivivax sp.]|nr:haloacid dehalogenase type II [Rubrivivax sp.]